jgi:hypothetical protein
VVALLHRGIRDSGFADRSAAAYRVEQQRVFTASGVSPLVLSGSYPPLGVVARSPSSMVTEGRIHP